MTFRPCFLIVPLIVSWPTLLKGAEGIDLRVRDVTTGYAVRATVVMESVEEGVFGPQKVSTDEFGRLRYELKPGHYLFGISAQGYRPQRTHYVVKPEDYLRFQSNLSPLDPPAEYRPEVFDSKLRPGYTLIHGFVVDADTGQPVAGADVRTRKTQVQTQTDARGYFEIYAPSAPRAGPDKAPPTEDLVIRLPGYKTHIMRNFWIMEGMDSAFKIGLEGGSGTNEHDQTHKMMRGDTPTQGNQSSYPDASSSPLPKRVREWLYPSGALPGK